MAVAKEADANSSCSSGSDDQDIIEEVSCCPSKCEPLSDNDDDNYGVNPFNDDDNDEVKQAGVNLSNEAVKLLRHASRYVMKRKQRRIIGKRKETIPSSLYKELQSLQNLIPPHNFGDIDTKPCVITDALGYLKLLRQEIKDLNECLLRSQDSQVEVISSGQRLEIQVSCNKRTGLLAELLLVLESAGLIFDEMDASCHHRLLFQASSTQKGVHLLDKQAIRRAVLRVIHKN